MNIVAVSKEQAYVHSLRLFRSVSEWSTSGKVNTNSIVHDVLAIAYFLVPSDGEDILLTLSDSDAVVMDMTANLIAAAQLTNPSRLSVSNESFGRPRGVVMQIMLKIIIDWLKEQGIEDIIAWIVNNVGK